MKWLDSTLGELAKKDGGLIQTGPFGSQLHQAEYESEGTPVIMPKDITDGRVSAESVARVSEETANRLARHKLKPRSIVLPRRGEITKRAFIRGDQEGWLCGTGCLKIELLGKHLLPEFLYLFMDQGHVVQWLEQHAVGTTMLNLSAGIVAQLPIHYPPIEMQQEIARVLFAYDELIENNRRRVALLEGSARLLYREWFVRLRFPGHEATQIVSRVPQDWRRVTIGDYMAQGEIQLQTGPFGTQLKASDYSDSGTPLINVRNIGYGDLRADKVEYVPEAIAERLRAHILEFGDIVFGRKGAVDRHLLIGVPQTHWLQGSDCIRLRILSEAISPVFLSFAFREEEHKHWMLTQCSNKATMASLNQEVIARIPILVPNRRLLREFGDFAACILTQIAKLQNQADNARRARDLLLPRLMSGEISV
jgi:type I restriction enzyme S subunit